MKNFSHSRDSTYWATEYPCSYSVLSLESISETRAKARPLLAVVMPVTEFKCCAPNNQLSSWLVLMQVILFLVQIFRQCLSTICKLVSFFLFNEVSSFFEAFSGSCYQLPAILDLSAFELCDLMFCKSCCFLLHFLLVSWQFPWFIFLLSFLCFRCDTWGGREITYCLQALITHSAELFFKTGHVYPTIWLKTFALSWGGGYICWCYFEHLGAWRELSAPPGDFWLTLRNLAHS